MRLSRREASIAVVAVLAVALLLADRYVITPLMESGAALEAEKGLVVRELEEAGRLFQRRRLLARRWQEMTAGGLSSDPSAAEGRLLHAVGDWAEQAGLALSSVQPDRRAPGKGAAVGEIVVQASGTGTMRSVARFLWLAETTDLPLRIQELQLGARTEGADDLSLQLELSTIYAAGEAAGGGAR